MQDVSKDRELLEEVNLLSENIIKTLDESGVSQRAISVALAEVLTLVTDVTLKEGGYTPEPSTVLLKYSQSGLTIQVSTNAEVDKESPTVMH